MSIEGIDDRGLLVEPLEQSWFKKFITVWSNPSFGQVYVNKNSMTVNIYLGFRMLQGKVLIWSAKRNIRWVTKKWFKQGHQMLLYKNKSVVKANLIVETPAGEIIPDEEFYKISDRDYSILREYFNRKEVRDELKRLAEQIESKIYLFRVGMPVEFILPIIIPIIVVLLIILFY